MMITEKERKMNEKWRRKKDQRTQSKKVSEWVREGGRRKKERQMDTSKNVSERERKEVERKKERQMDTGKRATERDGQWRRE